MGFRLTVMPKNAVNSGITRKQPQTGNRQNQAQSEPTEERQQKDKQPLKRKATDAWQDQAGRQDWTRDPIT